MILEGEQSGSKPKRAGEEADRVTVWSGIWCWYVRVRKRLKYALANEQNFDRYDSPAPTQFSLPGLS